MSNETFHRHVMEIRILLSVTTRIAGQALEARLNACEAGISPLQFAVMRLLQFEPRTITDLSRKLILDPSTLVPVIDSLERKGLVERGKDPHDRRRTPLSLTGDGRALLARVPPTDRDDALVQAVAALGEAHADQLLRLLRELIRHLPDGSRILDEIGHRMCLVETEVADSAPAQAETSGG